MQNQHQTKDGKVWTKGTNEILSGLWDVSLPYLYITEQPGEHWCGLYSGICIPFLSLLSHIYASINRVGVTVRVLSALNRMTRFTNDWLINSGVTRLSVAAITSQLSAFDASSWLLLSTVNVLLLASRQSTCCWLSSSLYTWPLPVRELEAAFLTGKQG